MLKIIIIAVTVVYCIGLIYHYGIRKSIQYKKQIGLTKLNDDYKSMLEITKGAKK